MTVLNREKSRGQGQEEEDEKGVAAFDRSFIELVGRSCQLEGWNPPRDSLYGLRFIPFLDIGHHLEPGRNRTG